MRQRNVYEVVLSPELAAEVERLRGEVPRSAWIRGAVEMRVEKALFINGVLSAGNDRLDAYEPRGKKDRT